METSSHYEDEPRLTQELSDIYVDTVFVHDTERVEIDLNNEDVMSGNHRSDSEKGRKGITQPQQDSMSGDD